MDSELGVIRTVCEKSRKNTDNRARRMDPIWKYNVTTARDRYVQLDNIHVYVDIMITHTSNTSI